LREQREKTPTRKDINMQQGTKSLSLPKLPGAKSNARKTGGLEVDLLRRRFLHSIH
jgi:hypothetical protein